MSVLRHFVEAVGGAWELARIAFMSHFRGGNAYWAWRRETAFGTQARNVKSGTDKSFRARAGAILRFGAWVFRMKRFR